MVVNFKTLKIMTWKNEERSKIKKIKILELKRQIITQFNDIKLKFNQCIDIHDRFEMYTMTQ